jgi:hypothetical protein
MQQKLQYSQLHNLYANLQYFTRVLIDNLGVLIAGGITPASRITNAFVEDQSAGNDPKAVCTVVSTGKKMSAVGAALANGIAAGMLESMRCIAYEQYVIDDETIGQACKILEGISTGDDHLAFEAIREVGPGGNYLLSEYFQGNGISDKGEREAWIEKGSLSAKKQLTVWGNAPHPPMMDLKIWTASILIQTFYFAAIMKH